MSTKAKVQSVPEFDRLYKNLNKGQKEAVDAIEGPVMVIAGPGTGKTTILTLRIANILKKTDTPPHGILAITFTEAGVKAMRAKLRAIIGDRAHEVRIHTFHGFAASVIAEYPDHFLPIHDMKQMSDIDQESLVRDIISEPKFSTLRPSGKPDAYVSGILRSIDEAKREALSPDQVHDFALREIERIKNDEDSISTRGATKGQLKADARDQIEKCEKTVLFADVYAEYEARKTAAKQLDFNDLILNLLETMKNDELLLRLIQERYLYVMVDEHQDTNDAQNLIIDRIADFFDTPNVFIVGDEKQAIYRFQGASVDNFFRLSKKWKDVKVVHLDTNYRSHQAILDAGFSMIENNYEEGEHADLRVELKSGLDDEPQPIEIITGENTAAIELELVRRLKEMGGQEGAKNGARSTENATAAVIVRKNRDLDRIIRLCESHGIAISSERSVDIFNHPVGKLFFDLIEYIVDPSKAEALARTIIAGMWKLDFASGVEIVRKLKNGTFDEFETRIPGLRKIQAGMLSNGPVAQVIHGAEQSGYTDIVANDPTYVTVWRGIVSLAESLCKEGNVTDPTVLFESLLAYRLSAETRTVKISVGSPDLPLRAMTAHGSKGLEFDYVFIPYANEESWVGRPRGASFVLPKKKSTDSDIRDVRRLFYVALTRAKRHAVVLSSLEEADGKVLSPLRFIEELDPESVSHVHLPRVGADAVHAVEEGTFIVSSKSKLLDLTKETLLKKGLSVTALNNFLESPAMFLTNSILKLPQAPSIPAEKGTAMHEAISQVWASGKTDPREVEPTLKQAVEAYFATSVLSVKEKQTALKELLEDVPAVAKALESHFALKAKNSSVFTETWAENSFTGYFEDQKLGKIEIRIPLHGKLDAILDTGSELNVFDYKARQAMSVNAIKGETKNSEGNYFRQLVFYKLLVQDDPRWKTKRISPALVFVSPDAKGRCPTVALPITEADEAKVKSEIQSLIEAVWSGRIVEGL